MMLQRTKTVFTDSGGIQEESCILRTPCVTLRDNTERQETVEVGANRINGLSIKDALEAVAFFDQSSRDWVNPFGDGKAAERIVDVSLGLPCKELD
jgi:UDP-N-acetylglucosamine 2-epimerase (non-hydrolysing)